MLSNFSQASRMCSSGSTSGLNRVRRESRVERRQSYNNGRPQGCRSGKRKSCEMQLPECQVAKRVIEEEGVDESQSEATSRAWYPALLPEAGGEVQQQQQQEQQQSRQQEQQEWFVKASYALAFAQQQCQAWMLAHRAFYSSSSKQQQLQSWMFAHHPLCTSSSQEQQQQQKQQPAAPNLTPTNTRAGPQLPPQQQHNHHPRHLHHKQNEQHATRAPTNRVAPKTISGVAASSHPVPAASSLGVCSNHGSEQAMDSIHGIRLTFNNWGQGSNNTHNNNSSSSSFANNVNNNNSNNNGGSSSSSSSWHSVADVPARLQCAKNIAQAVAHDIKERGLQHAQGRALILALVHSTEVALYSNAPSMAAYTAPATLQARVAAVLGQLIAEATSHCAAPRGVERAETAQGVAAQGAEAALV